MHTFETLEYVWRIFPPYCVGQAIAYMAVKDVTFLHLPESPFAWEIAGASLVFMLVDIVLYFGLVALFEHLSTNTASVICGDDGPRELMLDPGLVGAEDDDVARERLRVQQNATGDDPIVINGLKKVYRARGGAPAHVAVSDLFYTVHRGECFGFLGANGAGKTTVMKILTGDQQPSDGSAQLGGFDVVQNPYDVRKLIGYCPQFDALQEYLTGREHLYLYARIKCVPEESLAAFVENMVVKLGLSEYADKPAGTYSGGNKRKLSVGIALIGNPPIVFLDEPSTGMDPQARRFMWQLISSTMANRSVILTTHSMEECEALCDRIGIMTNGRLQCLGTSQHLKSKFGRGYQVTIKAADGREPNIKQFMLAHLPNHSLIEEHGSNLRFRVAREGAAQRISSVFRLLENNKASVGIQAYAVSETDLEQLFIQFVKEGEARRAAVDARLGIVRPVQ